MSILNAITAGAGGVALTGDTTGNLTIQSAGSNVVTFTSTGMITNAGAPAFSAYPSANSGALTAATFTKVSFDTEEFDTNNNFASSRFTPTVAGYYQINACVSPATFTGNYFLTTIYKNGSAYKNGSNFSPNSLAGLSAPVSSLVYFNGSTDYVEIYVIAGGTPVIFGATTYFTYFNGSMVRGA
jgi:hypothetical protein